MVTLAVFAAFFSLPFFLSVTFTPFIIFFLNLYKTFLHPVTYLFTWGGLNFPDSLFIYLDYVSSILSPQLPPHPSPDTHETRAKIKIVSAESLDRARPSPVLPTRLFFQHASTHWGCFLFVAAACFPPARFSPPRSPGKREE